MVNDTKVKHFIVIMPLFVWFERYLSRMAKKRLAPNFIRKVPICFKKGRTRN